MTKEKQVAGFFDSKRGCPVYTGDVYFVKNETNPYYKAVHVEGQGFRVQHIGTDFVLLIPDIFKKLTQTGEYIGNTIDTEGLIEAHSTANGVKTPVETQVEEEKIEEKEVDKNEQIEKVTSQDNTECQNPNAGSQPSGEILPSCVNYQTNEEKPDESHSDTSDKNKTSSNENKTEEITETTEVVKEETTAEPVSEAAEAPTNPTGTNAEENKEEAGTTVVPVEETSNVIVEKAPVKIEVIASTKEEKEVLLRVQRLKKHVQENYEEIDKLGEKVDYHKDLASTLDYKPFVALKNVVTESMHTSIDEENVKTLKERTKDFESIINIQKLLNEHLDKAKDAEFKIADLADEIERFNKEIDDLEEKIGNYQAQTKLDL